MLFLFQVSEGHEINVNLNLNEKGQDFGFTFLGGKDEGQVIIASILEGSETWLQLSVLLLYHLIKKQN